MAETELQKSNIASQAASGASEAQPKQPSKDISITVVIGLWWFQCCSWLHARRGQPESRT